ncbi:MAG: glutathione S-transferase family protein [Sphingomonadaceae bacterium]|nr:glutathione S-transferase family protein [Sphingomonadaceae bacterium]
MLTLHTNGMTPGALAVAIALEEKALSFALAENEWQATPAALAAFSGADELVNSIEGEFPILADGDVAVNDTFFILEYLDDAYPEPPLKPADAYGQWKVQALNRFLGERAMPAVASLGVAERFTGQGIVDEVAARFENEPLLTPERRDAWGMALRDPANEEVMAESHRKAALLLDRIEGELAESGGPWLLGEGYTITDIAAFALARPFATGELRTHDKEIGERTRHWCARMEKRAAVTTPLQLGEPVFLPAAEHARWG